MEAVAWKNYKSNGKYYYILQVNGIPGVRAEKKVKSILEGWRSHGEGYDPVKKQSTLLFMRGFESDENWIEWGRLFPYSLVEVGKSGKTKPYKLGVAYANSPRRSSK